MSTVMARIKRFTRTPQGQRLIGATRRAAQDPRTQARARQLIGRLRGRRR
jgi:hypothetical protein